MRRPTIHRPPEMSSMSSPDSIRRDKRHMLIQTLTPLLESGYEADAHILGKDAFVLISKLLNCEYAESHTFSGCDSMDLAEIKSSGFITCANYIRTVEIPE